MPEIVSASAERVINAPRGTVYDCVADMRLLARFLPPPFYDVRVEQGGVGAGAVVSFKIDFARGTRELQMHVTEPAPGEVLVLTDTNGSGLTTTITVTPHDAHTLVNITSTFTGETGVAGVVERFVAPRRLHRVYAKQLARIDAHARSLTA
ncbi:hypothetical protein LK09_08045 [Microbacterium mangrovi]|uniref:Polyketide cyclase n=1 Tax=Microbacterium mangrovi TaxID=1348253 RepID=A0A0B2AAQ3_9MICO|nr:SRPBCC family protein [Microbacterium mangrovi]KHK98823.1 hypothetical protein LK09_08045 [Microbacterium mangrovi]